MRRLATFLFLLSACRSLDGKISSIDALPPPPDSPRLNDSNTDGPTANSLAVAAEGDFTAGDPGILSSVETVSHSTTENISPGSVGDDPIIRVDTTAGFVYVVNRTDGNNVSQLDTGTLTTQLQLDTGSGTNPQDVAVIGTVFYVATLESTGLEFFDTSGTGSAFTPIDLGLGSAVPACNSVISVGTNLYVSCGLLDDKGVPTANGVVAVVNSTTNTVTTSFSLTQKNPLSLFEALPDGNIAIASLDFQTGSGCLEEVDVGSNASLGCLVDNSALTPLTGSGSFVSRFAVSADTTTLYLAVDSGDLDQGVLVPFALGSAALGSAMSPSSEVIGDLATCPDGETVVADTGSGNGLRIYSATAELTSQAINIGLAPDSAHGLICF